MTAPAGRLRPTAATSARVAAAVPASVKRYITCRPGVACGPVSRGISAGVTHAPAEPVTEAARPTTVRAGLPRTPATVTRAPRLTDRRQAAARLVAAQHYLTGPGWPVA